MATEFEVNPATGELDLVQDVSSVDHSELSNLDWDVAGHTITSPLIIGQHVVILEEADRGHANRPDPDPGAPPTLRVWSTDETNANDWIDVFHDGTSGTVKSGTGDMAIDPQSRLLVKCKQVVLNSAVFMNADTTDDEYRHCVKDDVGNMMVLTNNAALADDHDHAVQTNPTLYIHSDYRPRYSNNEWGSIHHDGDGLVLNTGAETGAGTAPTTIDNYIAFMTRSVEHMRLDGVGNLGLGTSSFGTNSVSVLGIANGTPPASSPANMVQYYAEDVAASSEGKGRDEAGNITTITPHPTEFLNSLPKDSEHVCPWAYHSRNEYVGKEVFVDMELLVREVERLSGRSLLTINDISKRNWSGNQSEVKQKLDAGWREELIKAEMEKDVEVPINESIQEVDETKDIIQGTKLEWTFENGVLEQKEVPNVVTIKTGRKVYVLNEGFVFKPDTGKFRRKKTRVETEDDINEGRLTPRTYNTKDPPLYVGRRVVAKI